MKKVEISVFDMAYLTMTLENSSNLVPFLSALIDSNNKRFIWHIGWSIFRGF